MKKIILIIILLLTISCSKDNEQPIVMLSYTYNQQELEMIQLVNQYRLSHSLNQLNEKQHISALCEQSNNYMISYNDIKHYYFQDRVDNLERIGYTRVGSLVSGGYNTNQSVIYAIDNNIECHKTLTGDYTDFGVSIRTNTNGKKFYTLTFTK
jgi:uncharacterized protein YkwD